MNKYIYIISVLIIFTILSIINSVADKKKIDYIVVVKQHDNSISIKNLLGYSDNKLELKFISKSDNSIILKADIGLILK